MKQKRVSFEVAKAIKEAGYSQTGNTFYVNDRLVCCPKYCELANAIVAPFVTDVWLWLWRDKGICIDITKYTLEIEVNVWDSSDGNHITLITSGYSDPEKAIEQAIEYLVKNDLIK